MAPEVESNPAAAKTFKTILDGIEKIPALPVVLNKILNVLEDPKSNVAGVSHLIKTDQAMSIRILKIVNSSYYGFSRQISTINQAIVILGFNAVKSLALSATVVQIFGTRGGDGFDLPGFWEHSIAAGVFADVVARRVNYPLPEECFCAAILHGVGKLILDQYLHDPFVQAVAAAKKRRIFLQKAEQEILGIDHCRAGAMLAEKWNLPLQLQECIRYYPHPEHAKINKVQVALVHVGDYAAREMVCGDPGDTAKPHLSDSAKTILKLTAGDVDDLIRNAEKELSKVEDILSTLSE